MDEQVVPEGTPEEVREVAASGVTREPAADPTLGIPVAVDRSGPTPENRLVVIGDSLSHGFSSGAIRRTGLSYGAIVAHEMGWSGYRRPSYDDAPGGLPLDVEGLLRHLEENVGPRLDLWEVPEAIVLVQRYMDRVERFFERDPDELAPADGRINHALASYGWDLRDALGWTAAKLEAALVPPTDALLGQVPEQNGLRAALRVYPRSPEHRDMTMFDAAAALGDEAADGHDGVETLVVFLGANNALQAVTNLDLTWSGAGFDLLGGKGTYTVWKPDHFRAELAEVVAQVRRVRARHVVWCTVPHVTIAPVARGIGTKLHKGSRYFPHYTRPWIDDARFSTDKHQYVTGAQARAVDSAIDLFNGAIEDAVRSERRGDAGTARDWYLLDTAGMLDRLASRRYAQDPAARPPWWTPYPVPRQLRELSPEVDSRFTKGDGAGGRSQGGLFSLDGVHPTTVGYGLVAQELVRVMQTAGVRFDDAEGRERTGDVEVDVGRLVLADTLLAGPPALVQQGLDLLGLFEDTRAKVRRAFELLA